MVKLDRIYTRGGDRGETSLVGGVRVRKHDPLIEAYGTVDEANAVIGLARGTLRRDAGDAGDVGGVGDEGSVRTIDAMLERIQHELFDLGADLATPFAPDEREGAALRILDSQVERLEREIDRMTGRLAPLESFVLPGGTPTSAHLHLARTVVRRAERRMVEAAETRPLNPAAIRYVNRLSDHLFVLARLANDEGRADILWKAGATRGE